MTTEALSLAGKLDFLEGLVLNSVHSEHTRRAYRRALRKFFEWLAAAQPGPMSKAVMQQYRGSLEAAGKRNSTINQDLAAVRKLLLEAADNGLLDPQVAAAAARVKGARIVGVRAGKWLTAKQAEKVLNSPSASTLKGKRDRAILALLLGCGLRREELVGLEVTDFEEREDRWVIPDLIGKRKRRRLVPVPEWVKSRLEEWTTSANIRERKVFRAVKKGGILGGETLSSKAVEKLVLHYAQMVGIERLGPHDLRRTCARLCDDAGGELLQIQQLLGHSSAEITRKYIGGGQEIRVSVNDKIFRNREL